MHAYRKFVESEMDRRGWKAVDLAKASGVSKQVLSNLLTDGRERLRMLPAEETVAGLASAFSVPESLVLHKIGEAMGLPVQEPVQIVDATRVSDGELIRELARRLGEAGADHGQPPKTQAGESPAAGPHVTVREVPPPEVDPNAWDLAAHAMPPGGSMRQQDDARADAAGEESQDAGSDEPA